jgi:hypothetical protein
LPTANVRVFGKSLAGLYDASQLAPVKGEVKLNALYLGESFRPEEEFKQRIEAVIHNSDGR